MAIDPSAVLARGRAAHEALMVDTVRLLRPLEDVYDPVTGATVQPDPRVLYAGRARVRPAKAVAEEVQAEQRAVVLSRYDVALPWSAVPAGGERLLPGDLVEVTASPDPRLAGRVLWVTSVPESSLSTAWRISAEDRS
ncbi:DUF6093 family protein [Kitasatospora sp. NPDC054939]